MVGSVFADFSSPAVTFPISHIVTSAPHSGGGEGVLERKTALHASCLPCKLYRVLGVATATSFVADKPHCNQSINAVCGRGLFFVVVGRASARLLMPHVGRAGWYCRAWTRSISFDFKSFYDAFALRQDPTALILSHCPLTNGPISQGRRRHCCPSTLECSSVPQR